jgi:hypothetical protein
MALILVNGAIDPKKDGQSRTETIVFMDLLDCHLRLGRARGRARWAKIPMVGPAAVHPTSKCHRQRMSVSMAAPPATKI